jgi:hypothetical protein
MAVGLVKAWVVHGPVGPDNVQWRISVLVFDLT